MTYETRCKTRAQRRETKDEDKSYITHKTSEASHARYKLRDGRSKGGVRGKRQKLAAKSWQTRELN